MLLLISICSVAGVLALPATQNQRADRRPLTEQDYQTFRNLTRRPRGAEGLPPGFKRLYVDQRGITSSFNVSAVDQIPIDGSPGTSNKTVKQAARYIFTMTKFMPKTIFHQLSGWAGVGVFTRQEKLTVFPQAAGLSNGNCGSSCDGDCKVTCTFDGRKWEEVAGLGGQTALIQDDNVMCTVYDPYGHRENILIHEFAHTIHHYGLDYYTQASVTKAYQNAKRSKLWKLDSYAMQNEAEYFAEGATVFLGVNTYDRFNTGGMNWCTNKFCSTEAEARVHLKAKDPWLFRILAYVFTDGHEKWMTGLTTCPPA